MGTENYMDFLIQRITNPKIKSGAQCIVIFVGERVGVVLGVVETVLLADGGDEVFVVGDVGHFETEAEGVLLDFPRLAERGIQGELSFQPFLCNDGIQLVASFVEVAAGFGGVTLGVQGSVNFVEIVGVDLHFPVFVLEFQAYSGGNLRCAGHMVVLPIDGVKHLFAAVCQFGIAVVGGDGGRRTVGEGEVAPVARHQHGKHLTDRNFQPQLYADIAFVHPGKRIVDKASVEVVVEVVMLGNILKIGKIEGCPQLHEFVVHAIGEVCGEVFFAGQILDEAVAVKRVDEDVGS